MCGPVVLSASGLFRAGAPTGAEMVEAHLGVSLTHVADQPCGGAAQSDQIVLNPVFMTAALFLIFVAYRLSRASVMIVGSPVPAIPLGFRFLFFQWTLMFAPGAIVLLGYVTLMVGVVEGWRERMLEPVAGLSPLQILALSWNQARWIYLGLVAIFIPFGVVQAARAAGLRNTAAMFALAGSRLALL